MQVLGDASLVPTWPSDDMGLDPVDDDGSDEYVGEDQPEWIIRTVSSDPSDAEQWALYTHFDLTPGQETEVVEGRLNLQALFDARLARVQPIVDRIHDEVRDYFTEFIPERLKLRIEQLQGEFAVREAVSKTFSFPDEWVLPSPKLAIPREKPETLAAPDPALSIPYVARLDPADFHRLQRTIRVWADAVERYPTTFAPLAEDRISDLLAATLRATHPTADREVFSRRGKTDILVHANVLADGVEPAVVFITETKWATKEKVVQQAVDPQLFGYLNASDTAAVLLVLLDQKNRKPAEAKYLRALERVAGHHSTGASAVDGWPLLRYRTGGRTLQLCVAFTHLPRT